MINIAITFTQFKANLTQLEPRFNKIIILGDHIHVAKMNANEAMMKFVVSAVACF